MRIRVLGAHNLETRETRHTCFLVDGTAAIDAGSLMTGLRPDEFNSLQAILLTHRHFDHIRDLPTFGLATMDSCATLDIYGLPQTLEALSTHLLDGLLYPNFNQRPSPEKPRFKLHTITPNKPFSAGGLTARPVTMPHGAPAVGFVVRDAQGRCAAFTGDTGGGLLSLLHDAFRPSLLFVEMTYPNHMESKAKENGHLTPSLLVRDMEAARRRGVAIPKIVATHIGFHYQSDIVSELDKATRESGTEIIAASADMEFDI
ncbi:MAG: MBL fold metallo-hydrolase [SAR202 cluster bacterium]|nr:MBL fold metallo-hydrolase [SAR202 cluster bacterium]